jgi:hypothetical protein
MARLAVAAFAFAVLLVNVPARAQGPATVDAGAPAETACVGMTIGSDCNSSTKSGGGTCLSGCCCHYASSPEGALVCNACLACSDTSNTDPAFTTGPCSDGGTLPPEDSGLPPLVEAGAAPVTTSSGAPPPASGCACASAGARSEGTGPMAALAAGALVLAGIRGRRRARS